MRRPAPALNRRNEFAAPAAHRGAFWILKVFSVRSTMPMALRRSFSGSSDAERSKAASQIIRAITRPASHGSSTQSSPCRFSLGYAGRCRTFRGDKARSGGRRSPCTKSCATSALPESTRPWRHKRFKSGGSPSRTSLRRTLISLWSESWFGKFRHQG